jgi:UDP-glucose 4-epimerase
LASYLITGGAGFIGSHLAHALVERGGRVRVLDNFETGLRKNLSGLADKVELREASLTDAEAVASACEGMDYVLHQGALPSVPRSVKEPRPSHETNIGGTFNVLEGARMAGVKRVVYAASSSAYGNQPGFPRVETMAPQPLSPYAVQKLTGELYMQAYWRVYGLETVCLRYFNIFGARQVPDSPYSGVMARFILQMMRGERPVIFGDGEQGRDFTHVDNVVSANLLALEAPATSAAGRVFNIACGQRHTLNKTYGLLATLLGFEHLPIYGPEREGDVRDSLADISAASEALGYAPRTSFEEGLRLTIAWHRSEFSG